MTLTESLERHSPGGAGVVTIAFGEGSHRSEAAALIVSLRHASPGLPVCVITDRPWDLSPAPDVVRVVRLDEDLAGTVYGWKARFLYPLSPFARSLYLDPDVFVSEDIRAIFGLLRYYDLAFRFFGPPLQEGDGLEFHSKVHGGVILFRRSVATQKFFDLHLEIFKRFASNQRDQGRPTLVDDERTLALALARSEARVTHLGDHLALHLGDLTALWQPPLIYHGRLRGLSDLHARLRRDWQNEIEDVEKRLWVPRSQTFLRPMSARWGAPLLFVHLVLVRCLRKLRLALASTAR